MTVEEAAKPSRETALLWLGLSLIVTTGLLGFYAYNVYELSSGSIGYVVGEFIGSFLIVLLIGYFVNKRNFTARLFSICLLIACGLFYSQNTLKLQEAFEISDGRKLIAFAKSPEDIAQIASQHPTNKLLHFLGPVMQFRIAWQKEVAQQIADISTTASECPSRITSIDAQLYRDCAAYYKSKLVEQMEFKAKLPGYLSSKEAEASALVERLNKEGNWSDTSFTNGTKTGLQTSFIQSRTSMNDIADALIEHTSSFQSLFTFLTVNASSIKLQDGKLMFPSNDQLELFNKLASDVDKAADRYEVQVNAATAFQQSKIDALTH